MDLQKAESNFCQRIPITRIVIVREGDLYVPGQYDMVKKKLQEAKKGKTPIRGYFELPVLCWKVVYTKNGIKRVIKSYHTSNPSAPDTQWSNKFSFDTELRDACDFVECFKRAGKKFKNGYQQVKDNTLRGELDLLPQHESDTDWDEDSNYLSKKQFLELIPTYKSKKKVASRYHRFMTCEKKTVQNSKVTSINQCSWAESPAASYIGAPDYPFTKYLLKLSTSEGLAKWNK